MEKHDVMIIGAGIGGLTAALALQRVGFRPVVYEQAPRLDEVGAGISLSPNAMLALDHLGIGEEIENAGTLMLEGTIRHYKTDELVAPRRLSGEYKKKYGREYYQIHRADPVKILEQTILEHDPNCLKPGCELQHIQQDGDAVSVKFKNGESARASILVGADGCKSRIRGLAFDEPEPDYTGYVAFRGLAPMETLDASTVPWGAALNIGQHRIFMRYTVRKESLLNFVGVIEAPEWKEEGWSHPADKSELLDHFSDWHDNIKDIIQRLKKGVLFKWALIHRKPLQSFVNGRIVLLGDAAHTVSPFLGQGAAMSIEDGVIIARCMEAHDDISAAFSCYDQMRVERNNWVMAESHTQAHRMMSIEPEDFNPTILRNIRDQLFGYSAVTASLP